MPIAILTHEGGTCLTVTLDELITPSEAEVYPLSLPDKYLTEIMASDLLNILGQYRKMILYQQGAKGIDDKKAEQFHLECLRLQKTAMIMVQNHPEAKTIADEIATVHANKSMKNRETELIGGKVK